MKLRSMENAINTSLDLLTQAELKEACIPMSVFSGPCNSDAAEAVVESCSIPVTLPDSILRSLKNRSLFEQPSPRIYQMYPLIQVFAKKIGSVEYPHLVAAGEKRPVLTLCLAWLKIPTGTGVRTVAESQWSI